MEAWKHKKRLTKNSHLSPGPRGPVFFSPSCFIMSGRSSFLLFVFFAFCSPILFAQIQPAPPRAEGEGEGPFSQLIIRGVTLINGNCAPPPRSISPLRT